MFVSTVVCGQIHLGKQGEHLARKFSFKDVQIWKEIFGEGRCELIHKRNGDSAPYPIALKIEDGVPYWHVSEVDTAFAGDGKCEIRYIVDNAIVKSNVYTTFVQEALGEETAEAPEPQKPWVDEVLGAAEEVKTATVHQPIIGENGNWFVWDFETGAYKDTGTSAEGEVGGNVDAYTKEEVDNKLSDIDTALKSADEKYLKIVENTWDMKAVYAQHPKAVANAQTRIGATEGAIGGALVIRTNNGNITAKDQTISANAPHEDELISRRYLKSVLPDFNRAAIGGSSVIRTANGNISAKDQTISNYAPKEDEFISRRYLENVVPCSESVTIAAGTSISVPLGKVCGFITLVGTGETVVEITEVIDTSGLVKKTIPAAKLHQIDIARNPTTGNYSFWISSMRDGTLGMPDVDYMIRDADENSILTITATTDSDMTLLYQPVRANMSSTSYINSIKV